METIRTSAELSHDGLVGRRATEEQMETIRTSAESKEALDAATVTIPTNGNPEPAPLAVVHEAELLTPAEWEMQLEPRSMREAKILASDMFSSRLFSAYGTAPAILSTIMAGRELGLQAMASLRAFHLIEGKPTLAADLIRALIIKSGKAKFFRCSERTVERATFETQRGDDPPVSLTYTVEEKKADGPIKPGSAWAKSPADMCVARASSKLARLVFPDVVHGLYAHEELENGNG
jgi:hypothetical protein